MGRKDDEIRFYEERVWNEDLKIETKTINCKVYEKLFIWRQKWMNRAYYNSA